jgi:hypothetical protein
MLLYQFLMVALNLALGTFGAKSMELMLVICNIITTYTK